MPAADGSPLGRVTVAAQPARRADGMDIISFNLTARGTPAGTRSIEPSIRIAHKSRDAKALGEEVMIALALVER